MDIEQLIRQEMAHGRHMPAGWAEPVRRVRAGLRRRRYATVCAVAALTVLAGLGTTGVLRSRAPGPAEPAQGVIAWTDAAATLPELTRRSPRPDARPCTESDLAGRPWIESSTRAGSGATTYTMLIPNGSASRCNIGGTPRLTAGEATPAAGALTARHAGLQSPATVDPGEPVRVDVAVTPCAGATPPEYRSVAVLVGQHPVVVPDAAPGCEFAVSPWYVQAPLLNAPLTVSLSVPGTARRGSTLVYQVTIVNPMDRAFRLSPCPAYRQGLGEVTGTYRLNCSAAAVPEHGSLVFQMRLDIPATAAPGPARVTWMAAMADGTVAIADLATGGAQVRILA